jgi:hypothetical protein
MGKTSHNFIQGAVKHSNEGRYTRYCERAGYRGVSHACIAHGLQSPSSRVRHEAQFAQNMQHLAARRR